MKMTLQTNCGNFSSCWDEDRQQSKTWTQNNLWSWVLQWSNSKFLYHSVCRSELWENSQMWAAWIYEYYEDVDG
jgi:hypothetical protein